MVNISTVARMFSIKPKTLYNWYRNYLSGYPQDRASGVWGNNKIIVADKNTGEIKEEKPVYVAKPENIGESMTLDDKQIGKDTFTIMTNQQTGKIALLVETLKVDELKESVNYLGNSITQVKDISCDMSSSYMRFCEQTFPQSTVVIDKFHVMKHVLESLQSIRLRIKNQLLEQLPKGKKRTWEGKQLLSDIDLLRRSKYVLMQTQSDWNAYQQELMQEVFAHFKELETAYQLTEQFRQWYAKANCKKSNIDIEKGLFKWYISVENSQLKEFQSAIKLIEKYEQSIMNYFHKGLTNAKAENMNGKIQRFIINNYGIRDKDFALYRLAKYFS